MTTLALVLFLAQPFAAFAAEQRPIQPDVSTHVVGTVRDTTGLPLPGAMIEIDDSLVAVSDAEGRFEIDLASGARYRAVVTLPGFDPHESVLEVSRGVRLNVVLAVSRMQDQVTVTAPSPEEAVTRLFLLEPVQVYRTPGARADVFRALQTLPGVAAPDDAAGLFVRGGDVSEVLVSLDDAVIAHPYRYETPTGGYRGAVDPLLISGLSFSTGGFSARYGNALSGILDLRGLERPEAPQTTATFGLAGASASIAAPAGDRFGVHGAFNRTFTGVLFAVNGSPRPFDPPPEGWDGSAGFAWNLGRGGRLKGFSLMQRDRVGVGIEQDAFTGLLQSSTAHGFVGTRWDGALGDWAAAASFGHDDYKRGTRVGILDRTTTDRVTSWRMDLSAPTTSVVEWRVGANGSLAETAIAGRVPVRGGDLAGVSGDVRFDAVVDDWYGGAYLEATAHTGAVSTTIGARADRFGLARATTVDPRLNVRIGLGRTHALRFATGVYHQAPSPSYYDRERGASRLPPMRALHYVAGYEAGRETEGIYVRAEGFVKTYADLPLEEEVRGYTADGYGSARGVDLFVQWLSSRLEVRGTASWLRAKRRWTPVDQRERYDLPDGTWTPDFEIPWWVQIITTVPLSNSMNVSASWRSAAGRPHTPIVDGRAIGDRFLPVFGPVNSERLPRYERLDVSSSWLVPAGDGVAILFATVDNVLGRANFFDYVYTPDYASRQPVVNAAPRSVYVGVSLRR
ncbi:MAG: TonB-dependent receptor [Acidobacteria bacterium]|nr:TonB-dependent receptor [Acidobacteriota bacterium]MYD72312.1 TonB-dependent receptor [Acidobacteriota bacterium]MYJ04179.1 TonB-dependent receptor [Acidobacteriota bacterium]